LDRVRRLRELAGDGVALMVDANGGYTVGQARRVGAELDNLGVVWFEEPVSSDDTAGLATLRVELRCDIAAGEYAADSYEIRSLLPVVDCLQLDATRCGGYTGWLAGANLARARNLQVSAHCPLPTAHCPLRPGPARAGRRFDSEPAAHRVVRRSRSARITPRRWRTRRHRRCTGA
jgi:L-alanine-DL-glutamate epimerase-like enolase superfamily enzyme